MSSVQVLFGVHGDSCGVLRLPSTGTSCWRLPLTGRSVIGGAIDEQVEGRRGQLRQAAARRDVLLVPHGEGVAEYAQTAC